MTDYFFMISFRDIYKKRCINLYIFRYFFLGQFYPNIPFDPNYILTEASDGFSLAVLHLALATEDLDAL